MYSKTFSSLLKLCKVKIAAPVTCPCNTKEHNNYVRIFQNFWGICTKQWPCLQHTKCQIILIYNLLFKLNSKAQSFKIDYCVNYLQLNRLVLKTRQVFKNKTIKLDKGSLNTGTTRYFLIG